MMSFSVSSLDYSSGGSTSSFSTADVSAPEGAQLVLWVFAHDDPDYGDIAVSSISGSGLSWSLAVQANTDILDLEAWVASVPSGGISSESMTVDFDANAHGYAYALDLVKGAAYFSPIVTSNDQDASGRGTGSGLTFNAAASDNDVFLYACGATPSESGYAQSETDGYTVIDNLAVAPYYVMTLQTQVSPDSTGTSPSSDWYDPNGNTEWVAVGLELSYCGC